MGRKQGGELGLKRPGRRACQGGSVGNGFVLARGVDLAQVHLGHAIPEVAQNQVGLGHRGIDLSDVREIQAVQTTPGYQRSGLLGPVRRVTIAVMTDQALLGRITSNRDVFGGKPIVRGMRISVEMIVNLLAQGETAESILADYPALDPDDIRACLAYAHAVLAEDSLDAVKLAK